MSRRHSSAAPIEPDVRRLNMVTWPAGRAGPISAPTMTLPQRAVPAAFDLF
jgi:hypothetical protein